ncbi:TonB-dependent receptor [Sphingomonas sp. BN140010]|uniref:TonB-dependent receptor n=1 Tax=Sphingomonas arvum TaxID=2992113 RepID=A0ABT3JCJ1_9SPHN|nr:TonB-dependent receptor [Sphingomonas sp. BN140010]MCW3796639.1 TonB-dependent receptor [Sphingomonas sp. BN140010]
MSTALLVAALAAQPTPSEPAATIVADAAGGSTQATTAPSAQAQDVVVTGRRRRDDDVLGNVQVLGGSELAATVRPTIGETLASQPGVSATSNGPNASRPVLRGFTGDRIRILADGIGSLDVSTSSPDHAVAINPLTAQSIEVVHGPAALLFGSTAIGGVVNVIDNRIPRSIPDNGVGGVINLGYGTAANDRLASGVVNAALGRGFVAHADASWAKNDELRTGGYILARPLREQALASPDSEIRALADLKGNLPNSAGRSAEVAGGLAYVDGGLNIGVSATRRTSLYGVPIRYSLDPTIEAESPRIDVHQTRYDARAEVPLGGAFRQLRFRGGLSDYRHDELEEDGSVGSTFYAKGGEGRLDLEQADRGGFGGASGIQYLDKRERIRGEEKYLPDSRQRQAGLFTVQHYETGPIRLEGGIRYEKSRLTADADAVIGNPDVRRNFSTISASAGGSYRLGPNWRIGMDVARVARAPSIDELFANGPHGGTASFERGDPTLGVEKSIGGEASVRYTQGSTRFGLTAYASRFSNFIYQTPTGELLDDLPVYEFRQGKATYSGFELEGGAALGTLAGAELGVEGFADYVRATIRNFGPAPQIPPLRIQGALTAKRGKVDGRLEVEHDFAQRRSAPVETDTNGFTLVNAELNWRPLEQRPGLTLGLSANNLFDVEARRHSSLLKDYAPLAGRDFRFTARVEF